MSHARQQIRERIAARSGLCVFQLRMVPQV